MRINYNKILLLLCISTTVLASELHVKHINDLHEVSWLLLQNARDFNKKNEFSLSQSICVKYDPCKGIYSLYGLDENNYYKKKLASIGQNFFSISGDRLLPYFMKEIYTCVYSNELKDYEDWRFILSDDVAIGRNSERAIFKELLKQVNPN